MAKALLKRNQIQSLMGKKKEEHIEEDVQTQATEENKQETKQEVSLEDQLKASEDKFLRLFSEFENFRRRTQKEKAELITGAAADVYKVILPILDDLDRAKENIDKAEDVAALKEGLELIFNKLNKSLLNNGLEEMQVKETEFNADEHEAITNVPAPTEELKGKVIDVLEKGYTLNGKIIRFPKVIVGA